jgi:hypothetical protein
MNRSHVVIATTRDPDTEGRRTDVWLGVLSILVPLLIYGATLNGRVASDYTSGILGTQFAFWRDRSFSLGPPGSLITDTVDKGMYQGLYYSAISPGIAVMTYPLAAIGFRLDGDEFNPFGYALLLDGAAIALAGALGIFFTYKICRLYAPPLPSFLAGLCLAFGTTVWPFATVLFPHVVAMFLSTVAVYLVLRSSKEGSEWTPILLAGWCLGLSAFAEYVAAFMALPLIVYLLRACGRRCAYVFGAGVFTGPVLHLFFNFVAFRSPLVFPESLKPHESEGILDRFDIAGLPGHLLAYLVSPYRGLLLLSPVLVFGIYGLYRMIRNAAIRRDGWLFVGLFLAVVIPYSMWWDWSGGVGYGPRFLILCLPYLAVPIAITLSEPRTRVTTSLFIVLFMASSVIQSAGAFWGPFSAGGIWTYEPAAQIPKIFDGTVTAWWILRAPGSDPLVSRIFAPVVVASLWAIAIVGGTWVARPRDSDVGDEDGREKDGRAAESSF